MHDHISLVLSTQQIRRVPISLPVARSPHFGLIVRFVAHAPVSTTRSEHRMCCQELGFDEALTRCDVTLPPPCSWHLTQAFSRRWLIECNRWLEKPRRHQDIVKLVVLPRLLQSR